MSFTADPTELSRNTTGRDSRALLWSKSRPISWVRDSSSTEFAKGGAQAVGDCGLILSSPVRHVNGFRAPTAMTSSSREHLRWNTCQPRS